MSQEKLQKKRRVLLGATVIAGMLEATGLSFAQVTSKIISPGDLIAELQKAETVEKALTLLQPPVTKTQITKSGYLLLDAPSIALSGKIPVRLMSELPGTELFILFNNKPKAKQPAVLAAKLIPVSAKPDVRMEITVDNTTELLLVAKAGGKFYSVAKEIKIGAKERG